MPCKVRVQAFVDEAAVGILDAADDSSRVTGIRSVNYGIVCRIAIHVEA